MRRLTSARSSASQSQHSPGCCPCAYTRARSAYLSTQVLRNWIRCFHRRSVGTARCRSCGSPVFRGMWTSWVHLHLPLRSREVVWRGNAGDVFQVVAGRVLGRLLRANGRGMEPRVLLTSRRGTRVTDLCTFSPEHARTYMQGRQLS